MNEQLAISIIKENKNQNEVKDAVDFLVENHSGIYYNMAKSRIGESPDFGYNQDDAKSEMPYMFWEAAKEYDESKGCKFSSYIGEKASWHFLKKNKRRGRYINVSSSEQDYWERFQEDENLSRSDSQSGFKLLKNKENLDTILKAIEQCENETAKTILKLRYIEGKGNKVMPFADIAEVVGCTMQNVINVHNAEILRLRILLKTEEIT